MIDGIKSVRDGGKRALSEALALTEHSFDSETTIDLLDEAYAYATAHVVGFTGPPGVGKSTLMGMIVKGSEAPIKVIALIGERGREVLTTNCCIGFFLSLYLSEANFDTCRH